MLATCAEELRGHAAQQDLASSPTGTLGGSATASVWGSARAAPAVVMAAPMTAAFFSADPDGDDGIANGNGDTGTGSGHQTTYTLSQADAERIYQEYQVEDDELADWELSGRKRWLAETAGVDIPDPMRVTATEAELLDDLGPFEMKNVNDAKNAAYDEVAARYGDENGKDPHPGEFEFNDDHADAFRHAYINALNSRDLGEDWTTDFWTAHERIPNNNPAREAMNLYNNEVGRRIARDNPLASDQELADLVEQAVADGEMVVINQDGELTPSNAIAPDQAGHPDPETEPLPGHPQERQTS